MSQKPHPPLTVPEDHYPSLSRIIDIIAFVVLAGALFLPVIRRGFRTLQLGDTDAALVVIAAVLAGLFGALIRHRIIAVISALVYGAVFVLLVMNYYYRNYYLIDTMRRNLKDNSFGALVEAMIELEWGCGVMIIGVLTVLCSNAIVRRVYD